MGKRNYINDIFGMSLFYDSGQVKIFYFDFFMVVIDKDVIVFEIFVYNGWYLSVEIF